MDRLAAFILIMDYHIAATQPTRKNIELVSMGRRTGWIATPPKLYHMVDRRGEGVGGGAEGEMSLLLLGAAWFGINKTKQLMG